ETKFIQLVEGEAKVIMGLYDKIKADDRHSNTMMIAYSPIKEKSFPSWHMGSKKLTSSDVEFNTEISAEDKVIFDNLMTGKEENGQKVLGLLKKFF
ncbi:MAG: BLUF domain-containing protein, partial [Cytophagia bacterium]|nr:BLUF domain-containing protein [Cytophagia bacterium]